MRRSVHIILAVVTAVLLSVSASAQTITSYTLKVSNVGAPAPVSTTVLPIAGWVCNQTVIVPTATVTNPTKLEIDDPDPTHAGKVCLYTDTGAGPLLSLPFSTTPMQATVFATNATGLVSGDSVASNSFTRPGLPPPAPTGARVAP